MHKICQQVVKLLLLTSPTPNCLNPNKGMRLMLALKSQSVLPLYLVHIEHKIVKLSRFFSFWGILFWSIWLHSFVRAIVLNSPSFLFLANMSFKNFTLFSIYSRAFTKEMLICNCIKISKNLLNCLSYFCFWNLCGNGGGCVNYCVIADCIDYFFFAMLWTDVVIAASSLLTGIGSSFSVDHVAWLFTSVGWKVGCYGSSST